MLLVDDEQCREIRRKRKRAAQSAARFSVLNLGRPSAGRQRQSGDGTFQMVHLLGQGAVHKVDRRCLEPGDQELADGLHGGRRGVSGPGVGEGRGRHGVSSSDLMEGRYSGIPNTRYAKCSEQARNKITAARTIRLALDPLYEQHLVDGAFRRTAGKFSTPCRAAMAAFRS